MRPCSTWAAALAWIGAAGASLYGLVLVLPQFFLGPEVRIAHGVLFGVGCLAVAFAVTRYRRRTQ